MSKFKFQDFLNKKTIANRWLNLSVNPNKKMTPGSLNFTFEGVKSRKIEFVKYGKLVTPILDLKHSQKLNMSPTVGISSPYTTSLVKNKEAIYMQDKIKNIEEGFFVPYFLGLHTQNQITGDYSLPVPYAIHIKDGDVKGFLKIILVGNFFSDINNKISFVKYGLFPFPGVCYTPKVIVE